MQSIKGTPKFTSLGDVGFDTLIENKFFKVVGGQIVQVDEPSGSGTLFLVNPRSDKDSSYFYFGGEESSGDWKINRYPVSDVSTKESATEAANSSYATLAAAWTDRTTLTYS